MKNFNEKDKAALLDNLPGMAFLCAFDEFSFVSEGCAQLTGFSAEEIVGRELVSVVSPEDAEAFKKLYDATLSLGAPLETTFRIVTKDGAEKCVLARIRISEMTEMGTPRTVEGFFTDVTKLINMESVKTPRESTCAEGTLKMENRANTDFWSKIGYGIRTPMNAILGLAELGLREDMPATVRKYTQDIKKSGKKLMAAFNDIMDFKKIENGEMDIVAEEYSLDAMISDVVRTMKEERSPAEFIVFVDKNLPNELVGDAARFRQVLQILLSNAVKFTERGYISLSVGGKVKNGMANLSIEIEDTGRGLKAEDAENLFKDFAKFDSSMLENTGFGLAIARGLIKLMGGEIRVKSSYGIGCVFTVEISQKIVGYGSPICQINDVENKYVLILEQRSINTNSIVKILNNLGVAQRVVDNDADFYDAIIEGTFTHIFAASDMYGMFCRTYPEVSGAAQVILFSENESNVEFDGVVLGKPLYCVPIAEVLNGTRSESRRRTAPPAGSTVYAGFTAPAARILIVDDISANLTVAEGFLAPYKMQIDTAESGAQAIKAVQKNRYDLILMDHLMPVMTGAEAAIYIRGLLGPTAATDCKNVPIIALTANTENASRRIFRRSGINDFLAKPIDASMLNIILEKWIPVKMQEDITPTSAPAPSVDLKIDGMDVKKGIAAVDGNGEIYLRVLKDYYKNGTELTPLLENYAKTGDMKNYHIHAHALNSISRTIGAEEIAELAAALENAAERGNVAFVREKNPEFLRMLGLILRNIHTAIGAMDLPEEATAARKKKILIIDDVSSYLMIFSSMLKGEYETLTALDAADGIETARRARPDLILLDIIMPELSGYRALEILKADEELAHIPVILVSGKDQEVNEAKGKKLGAAGYLQKPFDAAELLEKVKAAL